MACTSLVFLVGLVIAIHRIPPRKDKADDKPTIIPPSHPIKASAPPTGLPQVNADAKSEAKTQVQKESEKETKKEAQSIQGSAKLGEVDPEVGSQPWARIPTLARGQTIVILMYAILFTTIIFGLCAIRGQLCNQRDSCEAVKYQAFGSGCSPGFSTSSSDCYLDSASSESDISQKELNRHYRRIEQFSKRLDAHSKRCQSTSSSEVSSTATPFTYSNSQGGSSTESSVI